MLSVLPLCVLFPCQIDQSWDAHKLSIVQLGIWYTRKPIEYAYIFVWSGTGGGMMYFTMQGGLGLTLRSSKIRLIFFRGEFVLG